LPIETQQIYAGLDPAQSHPGSRENRIALEALASLCQNNPEIAPSIVIPKYSPRLRGSSLERTVYSHAIEVRNNARLKAIMTPAIDSLIKVAFPISSITSNLCDHWFWMIFVLVS